MKIGIIVVFALFASAFAAHFLLSDPGYVVINFRGYLVEMSVPVLVLLTAVLFAMIWLIRKQLAALALFDDESAGGKVLGEINRRWNAVAADAFNDCKRGAHKGFSGSLESLVNESQGLAERLRTLT